jgi:glutathione S-transferase
LIQLYYVPRTRSTRPRWLLEELGVPYELKVLDPRKGDTKRPDYLAVNPSGKVPALVDGDVCLFESAAICMYLADRFPEAGLCPPVGSRERAAYYQWICYAITTLEVPVAEVSYHTVVRAEELRVGLIADEARILFSRVIQPAETQLGKAPFILGEAFSAADVALGASLAWARTLKLLDNYPNARGYVERLVDRPAFKRSRTD